VYICAFFLVFFLFLDIGTPLRVNADGNCLFKSISTLLYGHEDRARELRVRICIQMCTRAIILQTDDHAESVAQSRQASSKVGDSNSMFPASGLERYLSMLLHICMQTSPSLLFYTGMKIGRGN
jgi:hypothetical protein